LPSLLTPASSSSSCTCTYNHNILTVQSGYGKTERDHPGHQQPDCAKTVAIMMIQSWHSSFRSSALAVAAMAIATTGTPNAAFAYDNGLGLTPPMGWNSWNKFHCDGLNETLVLDMADALIESGLHDAGYTYINLDDCWQKSRNKDGTIQEDLDKFPSTIPALVDNIHDKGLLFGLYSDAGYRTCALRPGSLGYEVQDATTYASWDVDYLKYDNCYADPLTAKSRYKAMHDALNSTDRPIFFSMCEWGWQDPATWAREYANSWRTTGDIKPTWESWTMILDQNDQWHEYAGPGGWNDPDMLEAGNGELLDSLVQARSHFTLWCLIKAPLLLGNDLRAMSDEILEIISNREVIAWNQDKLGHQGHKVATYFADGTRASTKQQFTTQRQLRTQQQHQTASNVKGDASKSSLSSLSSSNPNAKWTDDKDGPLQVWTGKLSEDRIALVLFNRSPTAANITAEWNDIGLDASTSANVRCVWWHKDLGSFSASFTAEVESLGVAAFELSPVQYQ